MPSYLNGKHVQLGISDILDIIDGPENAIPRKTPGRLLLLENLLDSVACMRCGEKILSPLVCTMHHCPTARYCPGNPWRHESNV